MKRLKYLITGTGRCGTGYLSRVFASAGVPCAHEGIFTHDGLGGAIGRFADIGELEGEASWMMTPFLDEEKITDGATVIHLIRHPRDTIESLVRMGLFSDDPPKRRKPYADFARLHMPDAFTMFKNPINRAAFFFIEWNKRIAKRCAELPDTRLWRLENDPAELLASLDIVPEGPLYAYPRYNAAVAPLVQVELEDIRTILHGDLLGFCGEHGYDFNKPRPQPRVFWSVMMERTIHNYAVSSLLDLAMAAGMSNMPRIGALYGRTDAARNLICHSFLQLSRHPDDKIIMLDCDHQHPPDILERLAARPEGVVAALAFRRSAPYEPMFFVRQNGRLRKPGEFERIVYECDAVGTGAIAIKRSALDTLMKAGYNYFFRYEYTDEDWRSSEDMYFARICEEAGIKHHVDCSLETPHLRTTNVTSEDWFEFRDKHPELLSESEQEAIA